MKVIVPVALFFLEPGKVYIQQLHISAKHTVVDLTFKGFLSMGVKKVQKNNPF